MPTLTIRNIPDHVIRSLKSLAARNARSMEQEVREILEENVIDRISTLEQIENPGNGRRRPAPPKSTAGSAPGANESCR